MTKLEIVNILKERLKEETSITEETIATLVNSTDIDAEVEKIKALYVVSIWDKVSPINGAAPELVLSQLPHSLPDWKGITYLISAFGAVKYMQPNDHAQPGWTPILTEERALELANAQVLHLAEEGVIGSLITDLRGE